MNVLKLLTEGLNDVVGTAFAVEPHPEKAALFLGRHIESKPKALELPAAAITAAAELALNVLSASIPIPEFSTRGWSICRSG